MPITAILDNAGNRYPLDNLRGYADMPHELARMLVDEGPARGDVPTASTIGGCLRQFVLRRTVEYAVNPNDRLALTMGTAIHSAFDKLSGPGVLVEHYRERDLAVSGELVTVAGRVDWLDTVSGTVRDWKSKRYIPAKWEPSAQHVAQVNIYRWLVPEQDIRRVEIIYLDQSRVVAFEGEPWPLEQTAAYIVGRLSPWVEARRTGVLPPVCSDFTPVGKLQGICAYCDVGHVCRSRYNAPRD